MEMGCLIRATKVSIPITLSEENTHGEFHIYFLFHISLFCWGVFLFVSDLFWNLN